MVLCEVTINGTLNRVSSEHINLTNPWDAQILEMEPLNYQMEQVYGGYCRLGFGSITFSSQLFADDWPPPVECAVTIKYTATTQEAAVPFFSGKLYLGQYSRGSVQYVVYGDYDNVDLLEETTDYNEDTVPVPRAFGAVTYVQPLRLPDIAAVPYYHKGYLLGTKGTDWHVFDDGVNIDSNVTDNGDGTFKLSAAPVGQVSISGTGTDSTLSDIFDWACGASYLNLTYDSTYKRVSQPSLNHWATSQMPLTQFLSEISSSFSHLFYILGTTLYLIDVKLNNGTRTITEFDYFPSIYRYEAPTSILRSTWQYREAGEWIDEGGTGSGAVYVKETEKEVTYASSYPYGQELSITAFQENHANILSALTDIESTIHKLQADVGVPLSADPPMPGERIKFEDTSLENDTNIWFNVRSAGYDLMNEKITLTGEGRAFL